MLYEKHDYPEIYPEKTGKGQTFMKNGVQERKELKIGLKEFLYQKNTNGDDCSLKKGGSRILKKVPQRIRRRGGNDFYRDLLHRMYKTQ